ncbi:MAG: RagB/SusD family nutrient uptake outer membrane protein [Tannerellaceae bacterium]|jgi:hypothetical protein|nr:RagB/SusD family nutrient uptake outer membrane protein [Tannerellaceae bacterium]
MKKIFITIIYSIALLLGLSSCSDLLDKEPLTEIGEGAVWSDPALAEAYVNARYNQIHSGWYDEPWISSLTDESYMTWSRGCEPITQGYVSPSELGSVNWGLRAWSVVWQNIADCNLFFEKIDEVTFREESQKTQLVGQVRFIRALCYHDLVSRWGGMPLITKRFTLNEREEALNVTRSGYKECIDFIVSELDKAIQELPNAYDAKSKGRATRIAALALKARVLLYAASDLMNVGVKDEKLGYTSPDPQRWTKAAEAAAICINEALGNGYALYDEYGDDVKTKYIQLFLEGGNAEILFDKQHGASSVGYYVQIDQVNGPNGYAGWGGNTPTDEMACAFENADGTIFSWEKWKAAGGNTNPWANRDQRLYATVLADGDYFKYRELETFIDVDQSGTELSSGGRDTKFGIESHNTSITGYNMRKFIDENYKDGSWQFASKNWPILRLTEQYLNLAEAHYMAGDEAGAKEALNVIRRRARMPEVKATGQELIGRIQNERRVELCFEEHRYFDVRRWKLGEALLNTPATGVLVHKWPDGRKTYTPGIIAEHRKFVERMYWLPIPQDEIDKSVLEQNPGY